MTGDASRPVDDGFRAELARLVTQLLEESRRESEPISEAIVAHLGEDARELPIHGQALPTFELANLQLGLDAALARPGYEARVLGIAGQGRHYSDVGLGELLTLTHFGIGPVEYMNAPVGPGRTLACLAWAVLLVTGPEGPLCVFVRQGVERGPMPGLVVQAVARDPQAAPRFLADLSELMERNDVFRGQMITIEADRYGGRSVAFLDRPQLDGSDLILPDGLLERIERHVVGPSRHRERLLATGRHLGRGLLLWGAPGTGKTHTVRYLAGQLTGATILILSGPSLGLAGAFGTLARRLAPAVVVLEDVDLVAQERTFGPFGSNPVLFELMNEMSGLAEDADVAFVLTTNRPDALEPALAARPGRVDLAIEIPLPDAKARRRLLELYGRGLELDAAVVDLVVARTEGMTASFFKELLRKAALSAAEEGSERVVEDHVRRALDELLEERAALTRVLLGSGEPGAQASPSPHAWLESGGFG